MYVFIFQSINLSLDLPTEPQDLSSIGVDFDVFLTQKLNSSSDGVTLEEMKAQISVVHKIYEESGQEFSTSDLDKLTKCMVDIKLKNRWKKGKTEVS